MIFPITGNVRYPLTIDPTVWIFDERKIEVNQIGKTIDDNAQEAYYAKMGAAWDKGITEGSRTDHNKPMTREEKDAALRGTFAMPLAPFIQNAEVLDGATSLRFEGAETIELALSTLPELYLQFSKDGKVLTDGPVHLLYQNHVIRSIERITVL
ncbi:MULTISPECIES: hypothetical protein [Exiguobacterium]|uniref:Uncharacterized protein n=1 Tax=Exiguobacterium antarcticum TaxID=132920 RepID=A0ABT6QYW2_9BACL|nr:MULTISPECIES: hypothetical protein [Exiguobacterium]AFS70954.1 Hypothetical protein Eab7_1846 [Exiguobacterium antarcticum B7]MCT4779129.1 hypothetical protein [Exiguobacterium soli]MDI3233733.1 hypothetical protein [Exiguobacterium antarcticum]